jgi:hypothetical protein
MESVMPNFAEVIFKGITIHQTDEGNSEWRLGMGVGTATQHKPFGWNVDGVSTGEHYNFSENNVPVKTVFVLNPGEQLFFHAGGYEEDDPGFPLFDDNDGLPGFGVLVDPAAASPGDDFQIHASAGDFNYSLHYDVNFFSFG